VSNRESQNKNLLGALNSVNPELEHYLEFGVWKGESLIDIKNNALKNHKVYGFDSFIGLPEDWIDINSEIVAEKRHFDLDSNIPNIEGVVFFEGFFEETIPKYKKEAESICFLHVDCDLYSSTKIVLNELEEYIVPNTIIVFDEWCYNHDKNYNDGEQKAFFEWAQEYNREYEFLNFLPDTDSSGDVEQKTVRILK